jgi:hypothetical protein
MMFVREVTREGYLSRVGWLSESKLKMVLWSGRHVSLDRRRHDREPAGNAGRFEATNMYFLQIVFEQVSRRIRPVIPGSSRTWIFRFHFRVTESEFVFEDESWCVSRTYRPK